MSLKWKFFLFIGILHAILVLLIYTILSEDKVLFILSESLILLSLYLSYLLYKALIKPINLMQSGADAIKDKDFSIKYLKTGSKEIDDLVNVFNTMIDHLRKERISASEQSYFIQNLIQVSPLGIVILDMDGNISQANPVARTIFNLPHMFEELPFASLQNELAQKIENLEIGKSHLISLNGRDKYKCQITEVVHQGFKRKFIIIDDLTSELLRSEKEAYGRIIRMMAHEVNNSMGAVNSILDTVASYGLNEDQQDMKESLQLAIDRNTNLTQFMRNYASILRLPQANMKLLDLNKVLKKVGQLFIPSAQAQSIAIAFELSDEKVTIEGDSTLLEQAISNMLKNAIEAIDGKGNIIIESQQRPRGFNIYDSGSGIDTAVSEKLFTPFYSTKPTGQGVGLMLIREILEQHDCTYELVNDEMRGMTAFRVRF